MSENVQMFHLAFEKRKTVLTVHFYSQSSMLNKSRGKVLQESKMTVRAILMFTALERT